MDIKPNKSDHNTSEQSGQITRDYAKRLWGLISKFTISDSDSIQGAPQKPFIPPQKNELSRLVHILSVAPWVLIAVFLLSFFYDLDGKTISILDTAYPLDGILRIISVSGLIGFLTNWIAVTMLFRPAVKRPVLGYGLIPAHKERIAYRISKAVADDLINPDLIRQKIQESGAISLYRTKATKYIKGVIDHPEFRSELKEIVVEYANAMIADPAVRTQLARKMLKEIEESLADRSLEKAALKAYAFLRGDEIQDIIEEALSRLPSTLEKGLDKVDDFLDQLPDKIETNSEAIENTVSEMLYKLIYQLDVQTLVEDNIKSYDEGKLEKMIRGATNEQLRIIQYMGAILGTIGGLVIWQPILSIIFLILLFVGVYSLDLLLQKIRML
jgi:uncharacterized membrane protein YheB (UPF0754 family)